MFKQIRSRNDFNSIFNGWNQGVEKYFIDVEKYFNELYDVLDINQPSHSQAYPPYNMYSEDGTTIIELAIAGFPKEEIDVTIQKYYSCQKLRVFSKKDKKEPGVEVTPSNYLHHGIAKRIFDRTFIIYDESVVENVVLSNGILTVKIKKIIKDKIDQEVKHIEVQ